MVKITLGIPAYNVPPEVLERLLHTAKGQCPCRIVVCSDGDGVDYTQDGVEQITLKKNSGPGVARQAILEACTTPYITFADADDLLATPLFFEHAIRALDNDKSISAAVYTFLQMNPDGTFIPHEHDNIWVFGKVYRVDALRKYKIHFPDFRANEDTCFNKQCCLLFNNEQEHIVYFKDVVYYWQYKEDSITRINDGQYGDDQCFVGWLKSTTHAVEHARKYRPFSGAILQDIATTMIQAYFYHIKCMHDHPFFARQQWFYIKEFYHNVYKEVGKNITDDALAEIYSVLNLQNGQNLIHIIPPMGIKEFLDRLDKEPYSPDEIYDIWADMYRENPKLLENNVACGVMPKNYWKKLSDLPLEKSKKKK